MERTFEYEEVTWRPDAEVHLKVREQTNAKQTRTTIVALTYDELQELVIGATAELMRKRGRAVYTRHSEDTHVRPHPNIEAARDQAATRNAQRYGTDPSWYGC
jgi:hypothetical protein